VVTPEARDLGIVAHEHEDDRCGGDPLRIEGLGSDQLFVPSSLLSRAWSQDNLVTGHPAALFDGPVLEAIEGDVLEPLLAELAGIVGPIQLGEGQMGVFTWDLQCSNDDGPFVVQLPRCLDQPGKLGRSRSEVPRLNVENLRHYIAQGLARFVVEPRTLLMLGGRVPAALLGALPGYHPIAFGRGSIQIALSEGEDGWMVPLGLRATAEVLAEIVAVMVYHYDPETNGGTAITDVFVNDGDFVARRRPDGGFDLRLRAVRRREHGIGPDLFLLYLTQMMAYEDWEIDGRLVGLPVLISNPSVVFDGVVRGLRYRTQDLGGSVEEARSQACRWIEGFGRSVFGRSYRPFVERFLAGDLPLVFGADPRERWWRLTTLERQLARLELAHRIEGQTPGGSATTLRAFVERLKHETGRVPDDGAGVFRINDLDREGLRRLLEAAEIPRDRGEKISHDLLDRWPYRNLGHLLASVPAAKALRKIERRISFGHVVTEAMEGTLDSLGPRSGDPSTFRALANPEVFGGYAVPPNLEALAVQTFPTFEAYMDAALHDEAWGYYAHHVEIGTSGHFSTHPESLSPHYGRWLASLAFDAWQEMLEHGELSEQDVFPIVEFGAGNGRLARDLLDALATTAFAHGSATPERARLFASRVEYRIYEMSGSLRNKQRALLGSDAVIAFGDARSPGEALARDFPAGLKGFVVTNEVPDAFGVHKVVFTRHGNAYVALVLPRLEIPATALLSTAFSGSVRQCNDELRRTFDFRAHPNDLYLDAPIFARLMATIAGMREADAECLRASLWFEECYVPITAIPEVAKHIADNATDYAIALAAGDSGVVSYLNLHADRFIRGVASALVAGFVVTVDYGDSTWALVQGARQGEFPFRVYGTMDEFRPRLNDPYFAPGTQDLTADVNFTSLARAGTTAGLQVVHFGAERDVAGDDLREIAAAADTHEAFAKFVGDPIFKVLVQSPRPSRLCSGSTMTPLQLTHGEESVPEGRRSMISIIRSGLVSGGAE